MALSLVYPEGDQRLEGELTRLHESLPPEVMHLVGGRAMPACHDVLDRIGATQVKDLPHLASTLDELRKPAMKAKR